MISRQPLILIPGLLCTADLWRDQVSGLADLADCQVTDEHLCHDSVAAIGRAILAAAPPRFALAGLSMGGYIAFEILRQAPDRVTRLALLDTAAGADDAAKLASRRDLIALARKGKFKGVTERLLPLLIHPNRLGDATLTGRIMAMALAVGRDRFLTQQKAIMDRPDSRSGLSTIGCPTLVLCGMEDQRTPIDQAREMAAGISGARLVLVETCGHMSTMERPDEVNRAMRDWLAT